MEDRLGKILIIDDDEDVLQAAKMYLKQHFSLVDTEKEPNHIQSLLSHEIYDIILLDMNFERDVTSGKEGFFWLKKILEVDPTAAVVLITAYGDVELAVKAIKEGAIDFVLKPWKNEKLLATLNSALNLNKTKRTVNSLLSKQKQLTEDLDQPFHNFIGHSAAIQKVFELICKVAKSEANVLVLGENGTGKELVARELHRRSMRSKNIFISVDMGAISETLFESELFGHKKGAFTDAKDNRTGRFEVASGGTLFLDEIGNLPLHMQSKLLNALQNREIIPLGMNKPINIDIRLICATNMNVHKMADENEFRQDLLFRINTVEIKIPPLRERKEDIEDLASHFLKIYCKKYNTPQKSLNIATYKKMENYNWPGNVRELQHAIERAVIMSENSIIQPQDVIFSGQNQRKEDFAFKEYNLEHIEKLAIKKAIQKHSGNVSKASKELGLTRASLYRRMEKYGL